MAVRKRTIQREYTPHVVGGHVRRSGGGIGAFGNDQGVAEANQRAYGDVRSGKIDTSGIQETNRVQVGKVGDSREQDFENFVKAADDVAKFEGQIEHEKGELGKEAAEAVKNLRRFEKKMGYDTGVRYGGAR